MDSFAALTHLSTHLPTHPQVLQLSIPRTKQRLRKDVLYRQGIWTVPHIPTLVAPNLWILTSATKLVLTGTILICPDGTSRFIKTQTPIHIICIPPACRATSQHFHLPPHYENHQLTINISLNIANLNVMNVSSPEFRICHHSEDHWNRTQLHHLVNISSVPINQLYKHMINSNRPSIPFVSTNEAIDNTASL